MRAGEGGIRQILWLFGTVSFFGLSGLLYVAVFGRKGRNVGRTEGRRLRSCNCWLVIGNINQKVCRCLEVSFKTLSADGSKGDTLVQYEVPTR